jgi:hypothetical protein
MDNYPAFHRFMSSLWASQSVNQYIYSPELPSHITVEFQAEIVIFAS